MLSTPLAFASGNQQLGNTAPQRNIGFVDARKRRQLLARAKRRASALGSQVDRGIARKHNQLVVQRFRHQRARALQRFAAHVLECCLELRALPAVNMAQPMIAALEHVGKQIFDALDVVVEMREQPFDVVRNGVVALDQRDGCTSCFEIQRGRILDALRL